MSDSIYIGGGGLGDAVYVLNKFRKLSGCSGQLRFVTEQESTARMVRRFFESQRLPVEIDTVRNNIAALRAARVRGEKILNTVVWGTPLFSPSKIRTFPYDAIQSPYMDFKADSVSLDKPYVLIQANAGVPNVKYSPGKNWLSTEWVDQFVAQMQSAGLRCVLTGTMNPGITAADEEQLNLPFPELIGLIQGAECVLGLQGFITIVALMCRKRVALKMENPLVVVNHTHPAHLKHLRIFSEPRSPDAKWVGRLARWSLRKTQSVSG